MPHPFPALRAALVAGALATPLASSHHPAAKPRVVTITARDYAFDAPDSLPAGATTLRLVSKGKELHHLALVRVDKGKTIEDVAAAFKAGGPPPAWMHDVPGPNAPAPGGVANATVVLTPGSYVMYCVIPGPDHVPHIMKGMARALTVTPAYGAGVSTTLPAGDATLTLSDYAFAFSKPLTPGHHVIRVKNTSGQAHEVELVKLAPGKSPAEFAAWTDKMVGPPPGEPIGGVNGVAPGAQANFDVTLAKGDYALICFWPDAKDGKPHFAHGMMTKISL